MTSTTYNSLTPCRFGYTDIDGTHCSCVAVLDAKCTNYPEQPGCKWYVKRPAKETKNEK